MNTLYSSLSSTILRLQSHPRLFFKQKVTESTFFFLRPIHKTISLSLPLVFPFGNSTILHSLMRPTDCGTLSSILSFTQFFNPCNYLTRTFDTIYFPYIQQMSMVIHLYKPISRSFLLPPCHFVTLIHQNRHKHALMQYPSIFKFLAFMRAPISHSHFHSTVHFICLYSYNTNTKYSLSF